MLNHGGMIGRTFEAVCRRPWEDEHLQQEAYPKKPYWCTLGQESHTYTWGSSVYNSFPRVLVLSCLIALTVHGKVSVGCPTMHKIRSYVPYWFVHINMVETLLE